MGRKMFTRRTLPMALAAVLAISPMQVMAASNDLSGHWAEKVITEWQEKGLIKGYADGSFKPNHNVTRAEFVIMMNNALGLEDAEDISFTDVKLGDWYYAAVAKAVAAGYSKGYEDGTFKPGATITRAEAAVMIANAVGLEADETGVAGFTDAYAIPGWAKGSIGAAVKAGFMSGYTDGSFGATKSITRAEAVSSLNRVMGGFVAEDEVEEEVVAEDMVVTEDDTVIENGVVAGDLIIDEKVGDGEVYLNDLVVEGDVIVNGGGDDSIYFKNVTVKGKVKVNKKNVRVQFIGDTRVPHVEVNEVANITSKEFEGEVGTITIIGDLGTGTRVTIDVPADAVVIEGKSSVAIEADVTTVEIGKDAEGAKVEVAKGATVDTVVADAKISITGTGKVENLEANASGITVNKNLDVNKTETASGVSKPTTSGTTSGGGGGSSSGGGSNRPSTPDTPDDGTGDDTGSGEGGGNTGGDNTGDDTDTTAPEVSAINVTTANGVEVTTDAITNYISCEKGAIVETIEITMNEDVVLAEDADKTVYMSGEFEDVTFKNEVYGTFTVSGSKITVTPLEGNEEASRAGTMTFTVAKDVLKDKAGNTVNPEFRLDVAAGEAPEVETIEVAGGSVTVDGTALECEVGTVIDAITVTMDEEVFFVDENATAGEVTKSTGEKNYGKFTIGTDGKTITIVPDGTINKEGATDAEKYAAYNGYAAATGEVTFTVPANTLKDKLGNANTEAYTFTLTVVDADAAIKDALDKVKDTYEVDVTVLPKEEVTADMVKKAVAAKIGEVEGYEVDVTAAYDAEAWTGTVTLTDSTYDKSETKKITITVNVTERMDIKAYDRKTVVDPDKTPRPVQENDGRYTVGDVTYDAKTKTFTIPVTLTADLVGDYRRDTDKPEGPYGHYVGIALQLALPGENTLPDVQYNNGSNLTEETVLKDDYTDNTFLYYLNAELDDKATERTLTVDGKTYTLAFDIQNNGHELVDLITDMEALERKDAVPKGEYSAENDGRFKISEQSYDAENRVLDVTVTATGAEKIEAVVPEDNRFPAGTLPTEAKAYIGIVFALDMLKEDDDITDVVINGESLEKDTALEDSANRFIRYIDANAYMGDTRTYTFEYGNQEYTINVYVDMDEGDFEVTGGIPENGEGNNENIEDGGETSEVAE